MRVDGKEAAARRPSQQVHLYVVPGEHLIALSDDGHDVEVTTEIVAHPDQLRRYRVSVSMDTFRLIQE
ncbi:hypothetical protein F3J20_02310 [Paraburkholderia sp. Cy-641]|uniref:hypothetical protein n=1 Tax=Paraburkholderia sp. Cy-641 TaxID=2608337 RepID=UPI001423FD39|nr:hypothetical protein [Paraburkholderia sp. Cy-641]NIF76238.1 hypothetical protein [Paraburkholderia sp. Cy-641]